MINAQDIRQWVESHLAEDGGFLVDVHVSDGADIRVLVDAPEGMPISRCVAISRMIEDELDRDLYDFSLQVSTPGSGPAAEDSDRSTTKNVGREVAVQQHDGHKVEGTLTAVTDAASLLSTQKKEELKAARPRNGSQTA